MHDAVPPQWWAQEVASLLLEVPGILHIYCTDYVLVQLPAVQAFCYGIFGWLNPSNGKGCWSSGFIAQTNGATTQLNGQLLKKQDNSRSIDSDRGCCHQMVMNLYNAEDAVCWK